MSSFFTLPASQKKRKRQAAATDSSAKRPRSSTKISTKSSGKGSAKAARPPRDESISGSDSEDFEEQGQDHVSEGSDSENEEETAAERRLRLAERYLSNVQSELEQTTGFDAEEIDRDLIAERLQEDVAETKGRMYRHIASEHDYSHAVPTQFRFQTTCITSVAVCPPYAYTASKDMVITKVELPSPPATSQSSAKARRKPPPPPRRRPTKLLQTKGDHRKKGDSSYQHHTAPILCIAASSDGKFLVTGGADKRIIVWNQSDLKPIKVFTQHRDAVTSLAFRRGTNQLYSASADRTIKVWSLNELAYVETLFGHQSQIVDVATLAQERCVSAGERDKTVRLWKIVEETQLVFRGGGVSEKKSKDKGKKGKDAEAGNYAEGSIDRVAMIDDETFISGSDNGSLSLWSINKKKPLYIVPLAHGCDPPLKEEEELNMGVRGVPVPQQPRWITALAVLPYSDLVLSGSWDGQVRAWKVSADKKKIEAAGILGRDFGRELPNGLHPGDTHEDTESAPVPEPCARGVVNDIDVFERVKDGLCVVVALGKEHRLGRWMNVDGKNGAMVFEIPKSTRPRGDQQD